nr:TauD/TfdA family dioxygenase [uncultured Actinoplanes sp.]
MTGVLDAANLRTATYDIPKPAQEAVLAANDARTGTGPLLAEVRERLHELVDTQLDGELGIFLVSGMEHLNREQAAAVTLRLSETVGTLLPQDAKGTLLREVVDRGVRLGEGATGRYSDSRDGGNLHTDGPHHPPPVPDCFTLFCVHQARTGGALCLVHAATLTERLPDWAVAQLSEDFHFDRREADVADPTVVRPVLGKEDGRTRVCYLRQYIEIGHRHPHVPPLTAEQVRALDALDALLDDESLQDHVRLRPGQMIFINNRTLLHGRTPFEDDPDSPDKRLMLRTWIKRD